MMRTTQAAGCPCIPTWERSTFRVRSTVAHRPDAYRVGRGGGNRIHRGRMALVPEPSERAAHQDIHGYHGCCVGVLPVGVRLRVARAQRSRVRSVVQLFVDGAYRACGDADMPRGIFAPQPRVPHQGREDDDSGFPCQALAEEIGKPSYEGLKCGGGELGIRTPDTLLGCTRLAGEHLRPLGQLSAV